MSENNTQNSGELPEISDASKAYLKELAYQAVENLVYGKHSVDIRHDDQVLNEHWGAFVTLRTKGELRGCIGNISSDRPITETVADMAVKSASSDPRFPPIGPSELPDLEVEISILGPITEVQDLSEIILGKHGLIIEQGYRRGLLLPQVATENGMNLNEFLSQTCLKAGLPPDSWRRGAKIYKFPAEHF